MHLRKATPADSASLIVFLQKLYAESRFMLFEPDEFTATEAQQAARIEALAKADAGVMFVCEADGEIVGMVFGNRGSARRTRHSLYVVIGVLQDCAGRGVGRSLMEALEGWARAEQLHRIELTVDITNQRAIALYERCGFEREGVKRHARNLGGEYVDEYYMSKLIAV